MPSFSKLSLDRLSTCNPQIIEVMQEVIKLYDILIVCGYRNEYDQTKAYESGASKARWPKSAHNVYPSRAVDIAPYPYSKYKDNVRKHYEMAAYVLEVAGGLGIKLKWAGNWRIRGVSSLIDLPHFEVELG